MLPIIKKIFAIKAANTFTPLILVRTVPGARYEWHCLEHMLCESKETILRAVRESAQPLFTACYWKETPSKEKVLSLVEKAIESAVTVEDLLLLNSPERFRIHGHICNSAGFPVSCDTPIYEGRDLVTWASRAKAYSEKSDYRVLEFSKNEFLIPANFPCEILLANRERIGKDQYVKEISFRGSEPNALSFTKKGKKEDALRLTFDEYMGILKSAKFSAGLFKGLRPVAAPALK